MNYHVYWDGEKFRNGLDLSVTMWFIEDLLGKGHTVIIVYPQRSPWGKVED